MHVCRRVLRVRYLPVSPAMNATQLNTCLCFNLDVYCDHLPQRARAAQPYTFARASCPPKGARGDCSMRCCVATQKGHVGGSQLVHGWQPTGARQCGKSAAILTLAFRAQSHGAAFESRQHVICRSRGLVPGLETLIMHAPTHRTRPLALIPTPVR